MNESFFQHLSFFGIETWKTGTVLVLSRRRRSGDGGTPAAAAGSIGAWRHQGTATLSIAVARPDFSAAAARRGGGDGGGERGAGGAAAASEWRRRSTAGQSRSTGSH